MKTTLNLSLALAAALAVSAVNAKDEEAAPAAKAKKESVTFAVEGMSCSVCASKVESALKKHAGVEVEEVSAKSKVAVVAINPGKVKKADLVAAIEKSGFVVKGEKVTIPVKGMVCVSCSGKVNKALTSLEGVKEAEVSHEDGNAIVVFDSKKTSKEKITAVIKKTGYKVGEEAKG